MNNTYVLAGLVIIVIVLGAFAVFNPTGQVASGETIKIGHIGPLTGDVATIGLPIAQSVEMAVEEINNAGGINGRKIELIEEDGRCNPKDASSAATKLTEIDKVVAIVGGLCSGETIAAAPIAERSKTVLLSPTSSNPKITDAGDYIFRDYPSDSFQGRVAAEYVYNQRNARKVAILYINNDWGTGLKTTFKARFQELGGQILLDEPFDQGTKDLRTQLTKIKAANPDFVYFPALPAEAIVGLTQAKELGLSATLFIGGDGAEDSTVAAETGSAGEGFIWIVPYVNPPQDFVQKFKAKTGGEPSLGVPQAYDAMKILASVISKVGTDSEAIKNELYKIKDYNGVSGIINFDQNGDLVGAKYQFRTIRNDMMANLEENSAPIKLGFIGPLTGDLASLGQGARLAVEMAVKEINAANGINGRLLEIVYEDSRCNAKDGASAGSKLINIDKVPVIIGGTCSSETLAVAPQAEQSKVVVLSYGASAPSVTNAGDYIFRDYPSDAFQGIFLADYVYNKLGLRKVAILYCLSDYCEGIRDTFGKRFRELGGSIVADEAHEQTARDLRPQITKIKNANPEAIYFASYTEASIAGIKQIKELGVNAKLIGADAWDDPKIWESVGTNGDGSIFTTAASSTAEFHEKFERETGKTETLVASQAYDAVKIIADVMRKAGTSGESIKNELYKVKEYRGASGTITFDSNGDITTANYLIKTIKDGKPVTIYPEQPSIKLGFIGPLTSDAAALGVTESNAIKMALEQIGNKNLEVVYEDGKCNGKDASTAAQKLIDVDKVKVILGGICSGETLAIAPIAEQNKVIVFSVFSSNPAITNAGDYIFRTSPSDTETGRIAAESMIKKYRNVAVLTENTEFGQGVRKLFKEDFTKLGGTIVSDEIYDQNSRDFRTQILKIKNANPDAIFFIPQSGTTQGLAVKQMRELGVNLPVYTTIAAADAITIAGNAVQDVVFIDAPELSGSGKDFLDKYKTTYGTDPANEYDAAARYDSVIILSNAFRQCNDDTACVKNFLYSMDWYNGTIGKYKFDQNGDVMGINYALKIVQNGSFVIYNG